MQKVVAKSAIWSKINWTQVIAMAAMLLSVFGLELDADTQAKMLAGIIAVQAVMTWIFRTFFNASLPPEFAGKTVTVDKA